MPSSPDMCSLFSATFQSKKLRSRGMMLKEISGTLGSAELEIRVDPTSLILSINLRGAQLQMQLSYPRRLVDSNARRMRLPAVSGTISLNGSPLATISNNTATLREDKTQHLYLCEDDIGRRYLWARSCGLSRLQSLRYSSARSAIVLAPRAVFAGFGGDLACGPLLPANDAATAATLPVGLQYTLLALSLAWCAFGYEINAFIKHGEKNIYGGKVADIPSFLPCELNGSPCLSFTPQDIAPVTLTDLWLTRLAEFGLGAAATCIACLFLAALCLRDLSPGGMIGGGLFLAGAALIILLHRYRHAGSHHISRHLKHYRIPLNPPC